MRRTFLIVMAPALGMAACGSESPSGSTVFHEDADPPGAALALSLGGQLEAEGADAFEDAVRCAAALRLTARRVASLTTGPELQMINRAANLYQGRAAAEAAGSDRSAEAAIGRAARANASNATQQAQLAIGCVRRLEGDGPQA